MPSSKSLRALEPTSDARDASLVSALKTVSIETEGLRTLEAMLRTDTGSNFTRAVEIMAGVHGRVMVTGIGKSGLVARKIAATLTSTGTPAYFVHPTEASHGDLGMITRDDAILALSWSGESHELASIITYSRRFAVPLIAVTSRADSTLAKASEVTLQLPRAAEACPHGLAPTTSTTLQMVLGDCIAMALLEGKGFTAQDFKQFHPGGQLGANLRRIGDVMATGTALPLVREDAVMSEALVTMTEKAKGCLGVVDGRGRLAGVITDGDLRRNMGKNLLSLRCADIMTRKPKTIAPDALTSGALELLNASKITALFVVVSGKPVGIVHVHDLLRIGVV
jgi:arabinose-5-phosphate isomerase